MSYGDTNFGGLCVERVFNKFFDGGGGTFQHFACRDAIDDFLRKAADDGLRDTMLKIGVVGRLRDEIRDMLDRWGFGGRLFGDRRMLLCCCPRQSSWQRVCCVGRFAKNDSCEGCFLQGVFLEKDDACDQSRNKGEAENSSCMGSESKLLGLLREAGG